MEPLNEAEIVAQLDSGLAVVVRLPHFRRPYTPFLRRLNDEGRLVRVSRPSRWGNPIRLAPGADEDARRQAIEAYGLWLDGQGSYLLAELPNLRGKALGCYCWPLACHGDVLAARVNGPG